MGRSLVHDYNQVAVLMKLQHLSQKMDDLCRSDPFVEQVEQEPSLAAQGRHSRYTPSFASDRHTRRLAAYAPGLTQERRQRDVRFVLKIQNRPEFPHRLANLRHDRPQPFPASLLVGFEILPFRLLVGQT